MELKSCKWCGIEMPKADRGGRPYEACMECYKILDGDQTEEVKKIAMSARISAVQQIKTQEQRAAVIQTQQQAAIKRMGFWLLPLCALLLIVVIAGIYYSTHFSH